MSDISSVPNQPNIPNVTHPDADDQLDPWVVQWMVDNPLRAGVFDTLDPAILPLARGDNPFPVTREIARVTDDEVAGVPVRVYEPDEPATGLLVYLHGGGFCIGSIGLMDGVARELAHATGAAVVSVEYRLAPEHPYPAGLDDCEAVTRWALANAGRFGVGPGQVVVGGESAGGNLTAAVALRLRRAPGPAPLAAQLLLDPGTAGRADDADLPSREYFDGIVLSHKARDVFWGAYSAGRDLDGDPEAAPLWADDLTGLPPAIVILGGCDVLRDEGRAYGRRLAEAGVPTHEVCYPGQPHGFLNHGFPAADEAWAEIATWLRPILAAAGS